jgi:hypothetical protein
VTIRIPPKDDWPGVQKSLLEIDGRLRAVERVAPPARIDIDDLAAKVAALLSAPGGGSPTAPDSAVFGVSPFPVGVAIAEGASASAARADHVHTAGRYLVRAYNAGTQSIPDAAVTVLSLDSDDFDPYDLHDTVTNNERITLTTDGVYLIGAGLIFETNVTGIRSLRIIINGGNQIISSTAPAGAAAGRMSVATLWNVVAGDYFEAHAFQNSGGPLLSQGYTSQPNAGAHLWAVGPFD